MAALPVFLSAASADAAFATRLRQAIVANGGTVVSSLSAASDGAESSLAPGELKALDAAAAYVAVLSPAAAASARLRAEAERYVTTTQRQGTGKRNIVPVQLTEPSSESGVPALQSYMPVMGPYGAPELEDRLIADTLRRLGLPVERNNALLVLLVAGLLLLLLLACLGLQVFAPGGGLRILFGGPVATPTPVATSVPTATPVPPGTGLLGQYYRSQTIQCCIQVPDDVFGDLLFSRVDPQINIQSGDGQYPDPRLAGNAYAIRWTGRLRPRYSETYTFVTRADDGVRLWVDGKLLIDDWKTHVVTQDSATIALSANQLYDIKIEYYENNQDGAVMTLQWQSASEPLALIPATQLYPAQP